MQILSDQIVRSLEPPKSGNIIRYDSGGVPGYGCRITANGVRSFILSYRARGIARRLTIGRYPVWSVAAARKRAAALKRAIDCGEDPLQEKRDKADKGMRFGELAELYLTRHAVNHRDGGKVARRRIEGNLKAWYRKAAADINRADVRRLMETKAASAPVMANRLRAVVSQVYRFGISHELVTENPAGGVPLVSKETARDRVLTPEEIRQFWIKLDGTGIQPAMKAALKFVLVTGQRVGEACGIEWSELSDGGAWWTIPPRKSKNGQAHRVPLSQLARELLDGQPRPDGDDGAIFRGARGGRAIRPGKVSTALHENLDAIGAPHFTVHDLRRTAATQMASIGIDTLVVSAILNHTPQGVTQRVYERYSRDREKRQALDRWALYVRSIVGGKPAEKVVPINA